jgi:hypothetical protein
MLLLLRRFEEIQQRPGHSLLYKVLDLNEEDMTLGGVRWWKAGQLRNLLRQLMLGVDEGSLRSKSCASCKFACTGAHYWVYPLARNSE